MATTANKPLKAVPKNPGKADAEAGEDAAAPKKPRNLLKLLLLLTPLALAGAGGGAWYFLRAQPAQPQVPAKPGAAKAAAHAKQEPTKPPVFVPLEPFTVNLQQGDMPAQYLQVGLTLKVRDEGIVDTIKQYMPEIRSRVLLLLSSKTAADISTAEGKKTLATELAHEIMQPLAGRVAAKELDSVLFTSFVIQ